MGNCKVDLVQSDSNDRDIACLDGPETQGGDIIWGLLFGASSTTWSI